MPDLVGEGVKLVVVACSTAAARMLIALQKPLPVPVVGVVRAGAWAAALATQGTIRY